MVCIILKLLIFGVNLLSTFNFASTISLKDNEQSLDLQMVSKLLNETIDESIDPCQDFYQFSCGTWLERNYEESKSSDLRMIHQPIKLIRQTFFDQFITGKKVLKSNILRQMKYFHRLCVTKYTQEYSYKFAIGHCERKFPTIFDEALYYIMFHQTFNDKKLRNIKLKVTNMIDNIKYSFKKLINEKEWIDKKTKHYAFKKLNSMRSLFYDMKNYTLKEMETLYEHLKFTNENTFEEAKKSLKTFDILLTKKKKLLNKLSLTSLFQPNAVYKLTENKISYNLGIFMKPYFDEKLPMSFNYGGLGYIIGHEITHGFDDDGSQYNENGKKFNWWSDEEKKIFQEKSNLFIEQYNKNVEKVSGYNVNGTLTLSENIADNGGINAAFNGYKKYLNELGRDEQKIPGYKKYSNEQLFFIAYSQLYCSSFTFVSTHYLMMNDPHSPDRFRVLTTLGNQKSFSDAFQCKVGSKMNPKYKVVIWKTGK